MSVPLCLETAVLPEMVSAMQRTAVPPRRLESAALNVRDRLENLLPQYQKVSWTETIDETPISHTATRRHGSPYLRPV